jgi:Domain of Unknown Function (DUF928)
MFNIHLRSIAFIMAIFCTSPAVAQILPKAPDTGTPSGNSTPGTSRPETACPETPRPLTAIVANNGKDFTLSAYPTFWFYVPYRSEQLSRLEFLLLSGNERETIYHATIQLPNKPGVIKIALPNAPKYMLKQNQTYRWRLNLDCKLDRTIEPDLAIDGWVRRIPMTPQLEAQLKASPALERTYIENQIWYNAIDRSATRYFANTTNAEASQIWSQLLQTLNLPWIHQEPMVD